MMTIKDVFITSGLIVWVDKRGKGWIARGVDVSGPAMESLSVPALHQMEDEGRSLFRMVSAGCRVQCRYSQFTEFQQQLLGYYDQTHEKTCGEFAQRQRDEIYGRFAQADLDGGLRGNCCRWFFIASLPGGVPRKAKQLLQASSKAFDALFGEVTRMMQRLGGHARELEDEDLFKEIYRAFNPGAKHLSTDFIASHFKPEKSLLDCCVQGDVVGVEKLTTGFYHAGQYHGCLVMSAPPQQTHSGIISCLTNADVRGFDVTVNLEPCDIAAEIGKAESIKTKLERARGSGSNSARMDYDIQAATERIHRLSSGAVAPIKLQLIVHAFDEDPSGLQMKMLSLRHAITSISAAKGYEVALPTSALKFFFAGLPGCPQREKAYWHLLDDSCAVNLLPICGDSSDSLKGAEALYQS